MEVNLTITKHQEKLSENRNDSFWYEGDIAYISLPSGNKLYAEATGEIALQFEEDGVYLKGRQAVEEAIKRNLNDDDLNELSIEDRWRNNNWFVIMKVDANGNVVGDDIAIGDDYDHALEMLMECAREEHNREYIRVGADIYIEDESGNKYYGVVTKLDGEDVYATFGTDEEIKHNIENIKVSALWGR